MWIIYDRELLLDQCLLSYSDRGHGIPSSPLGIVEHTTYPPLVVLRKPGDAGHYTQTSCMQHMERIISPVLHFLSLISKECWKELQWTLKTGSERSVKQRKSEYPFFWCHQVHYAYSCGSDDSERGLQEPTGERRDL